MGTSRLLILALLALESLTLAQPNPVPYDKHTVWLSYFTDLSANDRFAVHFDTSYRWIDSATWRQLVVRPGVNINLSQNWNLSLTYGYFKANPNGMGEDLYGVPEHRVHQQFTYKHRIGKLSAKHRMRNEQRWIGTEFLGDTPRIYRFQERVRYQFRTDVPLKQGGGERPAVFFSVYDEVAARFGLKGTSYFDQNRLYGGLGFRPSRQTTIEVGAIAQRFKPLSGDRFEHNLIMLFSVYTDFSIRRLFTH